MSESAANRLFSWKRLIFLYLTFSLKLNKDLKCTFTLKLFSEKVQLHKRVSVLIFLMNFLEFLNIFFKSVSSLFILKNNCISNLPLEAVSANVFQKPVSDYNEMFCLRDMSRDFKNSSTMKKLLVSRETIWRIHKGNDTEGNKYLSVGFDSN